MMTTYSPDKIRNVAIVGHGGAGKTTLVEQLLFASKSVDRLGSVDQGNSHGDFDPIEVKRKISLGISVFPIEWKGHKINLIDVPGFPDFIGDLHGVAKVVEAMIVAQYSHGLKRRARTWAHTSMTRRNPKMRVPTR